MVRLLRDPDKTGTGTSGVLGAHGPERIVSEPVPVLFAYVDTFRLLGFLCLLCVPVVFLLKKARTGGGPVAMH